MNILVTGGLGYIGSHTVIELQAAGHHVVIIDNLENSHKEALKAITAVTKKKPIFIEADVGDAPALESIFTKHTIDAVIHFAAFAFVGESTEKPLKYYTNNVCATLNLLKMMHSHNVRSLIYSSSCTVYGQATELPVNEAAPAQSAENPYAKSKVMCETMLKDVAEGSEGEWSITSLRYFNPIGAHPSGKLGEWKKSPSPGLLPTMFRVLHEQEPALSIHGDDFDTKDGTCVRDYLHVVDLAKAHVAAVEHIRSGYDVYNLGTGQGYSVLDIIHAVEQVTGKKIPHVVGPRRSGDIASAYADTTKAVRELGWKTEYTLEDMCKHIWQWEQTLHGAAQ